MLLDFFLSWEHWNRDAPSSPGFLESWCHTIDHRSCVAGGAPGISDSRTWKCRFYIITSTFFSTSLSTNRMKPNPLDSPLPGRFFNCTMWISPKGWQKYSDLFFDPDQVLVDNLKVFPDVVLAGLPGQAKDNQVVSLVGVVVVVILVVNLKKILIRAIQPCSILLQYIF